MLKTTEDERLAKNGNFFSFVVVSERIGYDGGGISSSERLEPDQAQHI
jgi:hypothetical protein